MELDLETIKALAKLAVDLKLDRLKLGDFEIIKTKHESPKLEAKDITNIASSQDLDDVLFHSTSAPAMTLEQLAALSVTPLKRHKKVTTNGQ